MRSRNQASADEPSLQRETTSAHIVPYKAPISKISDFENDCCRSQVVPETTDRRGKRKIGAEAAKLRAILRRITGTSAVLGWVISAIAFAGVRAKDEEAIREKELLFTQFCVWLLSLLQLGLIILYSIRLLKYQEILRSTLHIDDLSLRTPTHQLWICTAECVFHLLLIPPYAKVEAQFYLSNKYWHVSLSDLLYPLVLVRNYHSLRFLFWYSRFSKPRTYLYTTLVSSNCTNAYVTRCILKAFALRVVLFLCAILLIIAGFAVFVLEKGVPDNQITDISTGIWSIAVVIIGYGDTIPATFFGELVILFCCFFSLFLNALMLSLATNYMSLNIAERNMYSALVVQRHKVKRKQEAVVLLQTWWRFMHMRLTGRLHSSTIVHFYSQLRVYKAVLLAAEREKERRFAAKVELSGTDIHGKFRPLLDYLEHIESVRFIAIDFVQSQYRMKRTISHIAKLICALDLDIRKTRWSSIGSETPRSLGEAANSVGKRRRSSFGRSINYMKVRAKVHKRAFDRGQRDAQRLQECLVSPA